MALGLASMLLVSVLLVTQAPSEPAVTQARDSDGELTSAVMDSLIAETQASGGTIFVISRLGRSESPRFNARRLHNAVTRIVDYSKSVPLAQVVSAVGQRTDGPGRVELYIGGRLRYVVTFRPNRDFTVDCCGPDARYYPDRRARSKYSWP